MNEFVRIYCTLSCDRLDKEKRLSLMLRPSP